MSANKDAHDAHVKPKKKCHTLHIGNGFGNNIRAFWLGDGIEWNTPKRQQQQRL